MKHLDESQLNQYLDGVLTETECSLVETHLAVCGRCRQEMDELQAVFTTLGRMDEVALTVDLVPRVLGKIEEVAVVEKDRQFDYAWIRPLLAVQVVVALVMAFWLWPSIHSWWTDIVPPIVEFSGRLQFSPTPVWEGAIARLTAISEQISATRPMIELAAVHWGWLLGLALLAWLAGTRLLFTNQFNGQKNGRINGGQHG